MMLLALLLVGTIIEGSVSAQSRSNDGRMTCAMKNYHVGDGANFIANAFAGETMTLECRKGYYFDRVFQDIDYSEDFTSTGNEYFYDTAPRVLTCQEDGRWDKPLPTCHAFTCPRPDTPSRGAIRPDGQTMFRANDTITYVCAKGTVLVGYSSQTCDMAWSGWSYGSKPPYCMTVRCPSPEPPRNGWITNRNRDIGSTIHYYCNRGYERYGAPNQTCQANCKWSETTPICKAAERQVRACENPVVPPGSITRGNSILIGEKVTHRCYWPEFLKGPDTRTCGPLGWSPSSEPECEALHAFDNRDTLAKTFFSIVDRFSSSEQNTINGLSSRRYDLFFLIDSSHSVSPDHFTLAKKFVRHAIDKLYLALTTSGTAIGLASFSTEPEVEFDLSGGIHADPGRAKPLIFQKLENLKHIDRDTNITGVLEFVRKVMIPMTSNARGEDVPKVIFLFSDGDATCGGNPVQSAKKLKELGVEIFVIKIGTMRNDKTRSMLEGMSSEADFPRHYPHVLRIKDVFDMEYMVANFKDYSTARTIFPQFPTCGVAGDVHYTKSYQIGGDAANATTWPWIMAISKLNSDNKAEFACTGTLISDQWVLTTVQCIDDRNGAHFVATSASSPDKFDGEIVKQTFRYGNMPSDVALLRLQHPLKFGPFVRPICLPNFRPTDELDDKFGDHAVTIGWNQTEKTPKLIQAAVPLVEDLRCRGRAPGAGYCAGLNTAVNGTCTQDIGSPLMIKSRMDRKTREVHWIQIGIAWQSDVCMATGGNTGRFNRLERFVQWIKTTMNSNTN